MKNLVLFCFLLINIISFLFMFIDKQKSIKHQWRISEYTLISLAVCGGSLGIISGMYVFRHKTQKSKFKIGIPFIIFFQFLLLFSI